MRARRTKRNSQKLPQGHHSERLETKLRELRQALGAGLAVGEPFGGVGGGLLPLIDELLAELEAVREKGADSWEGAPFDADVQFYREHLDQFLSNYKGQYIALLNRQVVDSDRDFSQLAKRVYAKFGYRDIFMPKVSEREETVNILGPRLVAGG